MQRRTGLVVTGIIVALAGSVAVGFAQEAKHVPLMGKVTLQSGRTLEGDLLLVAFGVTEAARFGSEGREVDEGGKLEIKVNEETKTVLGRDIATVDVQWRDAGTADSPEWQIASLTVATRDGQTVTGKPSWFMAMSEFILDPGGDQERVHIENYPLFRATFDPDNLIIKVDLTGAAPAEAEEPARPEMPPVPPIPTPVVEKPAEEKPAEEKPVEEKPPVIVKAPTPAAPEPRGPQPVSLTLTITCPHCGEKIVVSVDAHAP